MSPCLERADPANYKQSSHGQSGHRDLGLGEILRKCAICIQLTIFICILIIFAMFQVKTRLGKVFNIWDVGGQDKTRPLWRSYTRCTDAIIFVVDSSDGDRFEEAKLELLKIAKLTERYAVPILVLANKQDLPLARDLGKLEKELGVKDLGRNVGWTIKSCCGVTGEGLEEAFSSLQELIVKKRRNASRPPSSSGKNRINKKVQRSHSHHF